MITKRLKMTRKAQNSYKETHTRRHKTAMRRCIMMTKTHNITPERLKKTE